MVKPALTTQLECELEAAFRVDNIYALLQCTVGRMDLVIDVNNTEK